MSSVWQTVKQALSDLLHNVVFLSVWQQEIRSPDTHYKCLFDTKDTSHYHIRTLESVYNLCVLGLFSFLLLGCIRIISYRPSTFWPLKVCKYSQSTSCVPDSALSTMSWWHGWNSGQHRVSWDWTAASGNRRIRILTTRSVAGSFFQAELQGDHTYRREKGVLSLSLTVGIHALMERKGHKVSAHDLSISQCSLTWVCSVGWGRLTEQQKQMDLQEDFKYLQCYRHCWSTCK